MSLTNATATTRTVDSRRTEVLSSDEVSRLLGACSSRAASGLRNRALIAVLYRGGLRVCEVLELLPGCVDLEAHVISVERGRRSRDVRLDSGAFEILVRWMERREEIGLSKDGPLFCTLSGTLLASSYLRGLLHRLATQGMVDKRVSAEVLRKSLAVELAQEGFSIGAIQAQLGHSSVAVTSRYLGRLEYGAASHALQHRQRWCP
jgi:site-specific recombinase XerD